MIYQRQKDSLESVDFNDVKKLHKFAGLVASFQGRPDVQYLRNNAR